MQDDLFVDPNDYFLPARKILHGILQKPPFPPPVSWEVFAGTFTGFCAGFCSPFKNSVAPLQQIHHPSSSICHQSTMSHHVNTKNGNTTLKIILTAAAASLAVMEETNVSMVETVLNTFIAHSLLLGDRHSYHARHRQRCNRKSWSSFNGYLTDRQFHRYFNVKRAIPNSVQ